MQWLGYIVIAITLVIAGLGYLSAHYYLENLKSSPQKLRDYESQLASIKAERDRLTSELEKENESAVDETQDPNASNEPPPPATPGENPVSSAKTIINSVNSLQWVNVPEGSFPGADQLRFRVLEPKLKWKGRYLHLRYAIQYTKNDGGNQQGRILILARGKDQVFVHPKGTLQTQLSGPWLTPERGEYFSVSKYREGNAEFGPVASTSAIDDVLILIFNSDKQLLHVETLSTKEVAGAPQEPKKDPSAPGGEDE